MTTDSPAGDMIDLVFPAVCPTVPRGHGYSLYGAVSRIVPVAHEAKDMGIFPINGASAGDNTIRLNSHSAVRIRLPASKLPAFLPLAGRVLELDGYRVRLGVPRVAALVPAPTLICDLVLIKLAHPGEKTAETGTIPPGAFLTAAAKQLAAMEIHGQPHLQITRTGPHAGKPRRRVIKVKGQTHAGYAMVVDSLTAEESVRLQERGLGGRRLMGCGLFLPDRSR